MNKQQFQNWLEQPFTKESRSKTLLMGVLNINHDSYHPENRHQNADTACAHAIQMLKDGVDIIDIGGESTQPFIEPTSLQEELDRVIPVIKKIRAETDVCISIDTYKEEVMLAAVDAGANIINDIYALNKVSNLESIQQLNVPIILNHMQDTPKTMQKDPVYAKGIINTINDFFSQKIDRCIAAGIPKQHLIVDPGFGFGKTDEHNLDILNNISEFKIHTLPILIGLSRKTTIGNILNKSVANRMIGSIAAGCFSIMQGLNIIRAHDVAETHQAITMLDAINARSNFYER